jgi:hypothetical protein
MDALKLWPKLWPKLWQEAENLAATLPEKSWQNLAQLCAQSGGSPRRRRGGGQDFWQYRSLSDGESAAQVDWRKSARGDGLLVREREQQSQRRSFLWCDMSGSMHYSGTRAIRSKASQAYLLGAMLWHLAVKAGDTLQLLAMANISRHDVPQRLSDNVPMDMHGVRDNDMLIIVSDFLSFDVAAFAHPGPVVALHVQDPDEIDFPFNGHIRFEGLEDEPSLLVANATALRDEYITAQAALGMQLRSISTMMAASSSADMPTLALQKLIQGQHP